ncbi:THO complex subunit mft1 [Escovopsis weberi]|uniref:THO complex subunit mft1 n=1 Tax=Escovopsis weberi TaxID=150374 RepID=A0A0M8MR64_ESCWE|nr:THO complex subunit mft1 [Escovopsis weberi]
MASWELLDEKGESDLHKSRLLNVEEKPFKRITKRLAAISAIVSGAAGPRSASNGISNGTTAAVKAAGGIGSHGNGGGSGGGSGSAALQEDLTLDFAAFDSSIARLQFLHDANVRERARYEADKQRILGECQAARASNARLREQLEGARRTLAQRRRFDELAERITANRMLRPREDQLAALARLEDECRELERESETYSGTWRERRDQFNRIMEEGMLLRRQIRDEKEEVDRREGMEDEDDKDDKDDAAADADAATAGAATPGPDPSATGTPRPLDEHRLAAAAAATTANTTTTPTMMAASSTAATTTPLPASQANGRTDENAATPSRDSLGPDAGGLKVPTATAAAAAAAAGAAGSSSFFSRSGSRASTREPSAPPPPPPHHNHEETPGVASDEDVQMDEGPMDEHHARNGDKMEVDT